MSIPVPSETYAFSGSREDFAQIIQKYQNLVYAVVFSVVGNSQQSEDLAQETFLVAWKNYGKLHDESKLSAWLCGIARNLSRKWLRDHFANTVSLPESLPELQPQSDTREKAADLVWDSLKLLAEKYREPLVMFYQNQASIKEIADALEITEDAVKQRLSRGRKQLKKIVEQQFSDALEVIRPGKGFCLAVLAAIPLAVQTTEITAATGAVLLGGTATTTASASTASPSSGAPVLFGLAGQAVFWTINILLWIAIYIGLFLGINHVLQSSPTLRSRRLMIQAVLLHYLFIFWASCVYAVIVKNMTAEPVMQGFVLNTAFLSGAVCLLGYTIFSCCYFNTRWKRIVEEDLGLQPAPSVELEKSFLSYRSLLFQIVGAFSLVLIYHTFVIFHSISDGVYEKLFILFPHAVLALIVVYFFLSTKNEITFQKSSPKYPEILDYLTGKTSTRRRPYFLIDACVLFLSLICFCWFGIGLINNGFAKIGEPMSNAAVVCAALQILFIVSWFWQLVRYAGIPRKRYWGFVIFGTVQCVLYLAIALISKWELTGKVDPAYFGSFFVSMCVFVSSVYIAMVSAGIIGLRVFSKNEA